MVSAQNLWELSGSIPKPHFNVASPPAKGGLHHEVESDICAADPPRSAGAVPGHAYSDVSGRLLSALHPAGCRSLGLSSGDDPGTRGIFYDGL